MLGNLFNQHKDPVAPVGQQVPPQDQPQASSMPTSRMDPVSRQNISALSHLDARTTQVLHHAQDEAKRVRHEKIDPEQLLLGLLYDEAIVTGKHFVTGKQVSQPRYRDWDTLGNFVTGKHRDWETS